MVYRHRVGRLQCFSVVCVSKGMCHPFTCCDKCNNVCVGIGKIAYDTKARKNLTRTGLKNEK